MEDKEAPNSVFTMRIKGMAMLTVCSVFSLRNLPSMANTAGTLFSSSQPQLPVSSFPLL